MNIYEETASAYAKYKEAEKHYQELRSKAYTSLVNDKERKVATNIATISIQSKKTWAYTDKVKTLKEKLDLQKAKEEKSGAATCTVNEHIAIKLKK